MASSVERNKAVQRLVAYTEMAAGIFLAAVTILVFVNVMLRGGSTGLGDFLNWVSGREDLKFVLTIPEWYHLSCLALGVCVFWGIAATSYRNDHIKVDILWDWVGPHGKRLIDIFATGALFIFLLVFAYMLGVKVMSGYASGEATYDLRLKLWPFHLVMALGILFATLLIAVRLFRLVRGEHLEREHKIEHLE
ncbi:MAG: TRAP transporter small permease [Xanthobacteraceae bacterium]